MRYRNTITGAVIDSNSVISGANWQEISPAGFAGKKKEIAPVQPEAPEKEEAEASAEKLPEAAEEPTKAPEQDEKPAKKKGATIKPTKGK